MPTFGSLLPFARSTEPGAALILSSPHGWQTSTQDGCSSSLLSCLHPCLEEIGIIAHKCLLGGEGGNAPSSWGEGGKPNYTPHEGQASGDASRGSLLILAKLSQSPAAHAQTRIFQRLVKPKQPWSDPYGNGNAPVFSTKLIFPRWNSSPSFRVWKH